MRLLLDTCTIVWASQASHRLPKSVSSLLASNENQRYVSAASLWEICVKHSLGHLPLAVPPRELVHLLVTHLAVEYLPISPAHCLALTELSNHHKDPFDRMLICQSIVEEMVLVTPDPMIAKYPVKTIW